MARENDLVDVCDFLGKLLIAHVFETAKSKYLLSVDGRGAVAVEIDGRWRWQDVADGVRVCTWEEHCFGETKKKDEDVCLL